MAHPVLLDNVEHHDLRLSIDGTASAADDVNLVLVVPTEFAEVQREYPILFRQSANGGFQAFALTGLDKDENLYLQDGKWQARYVPAIQARGPFLIGFRDHDADGQVQKEPMIMVDLDHPRISRSEGEPLFLPHGGNAPVLERVTQTLRVLHAGVEIGNAMFSAFLEAGLLAPLNIDINLDEETRYHLPDFFSISQEGLSQLDGATLERLNSAGFLASAFHVLTSMNNFQRLIEMKNRRRKGV